METDPAVSYHLSFDARALEAVVAFCNTGPGTVRIGFDQDGNPTGLDDPEKVLKDCIVSVTDGVRPFADTLVEASVAEVSGKAVVTLKVGEGRSKPYYIREKGLVSGGVMLRVCGMTVPVSDPSVINRIRSWSGVPFEMSTSHQQDLTFSEANEAFGSAGIMFDRQSMRAFGLLGDDGYTVLGLLVSDQNPYAVSVSYTDADGERHRSVVRGSVLGQYARTIGLIDRFNPVTRPSPPEMRHEGHLHPRSALKEVLVNALIHRDYSTDGDILVEADPHGVEVTSLGGVPGYLTVDEIRGGVSSLRNRGLAELFRSMGMAVLMGTGLRRMGHGYRRSVMSPTVTVTQGTFKVFMPSVRTVTDRPEYNMVMRLALSEGLLSRRDVEDGLGVSRSKANQILAGMVEEGLMERTGQGRSARYRMTDQRSLTSSILSSSFS